MSTRSALSDFSEDELRRELVAREKQKNAPPKPLPKPNFTELILTVKTGVEQMVIDGYEDDDFKHYVYEEALKAVYGPDYFKWRNAQKW